jgi:hypothetical protein
LLVRSFAAHRDNVKLAAAVPSPVAHFVKPASEGAASRLVEKVEGGATELFRSAEGLDLLDLTSLGREPAGAVEAKARDHLIEWLLYYTRGKEERRALLEFSCAAAGKQPPPPAGEAAVAAVLERADLSWDGFVSTLHYDNKKGTALDLEELTVLSRALRPHREVDWGTRLGVGEVSPDPSRALHIRLADDADPPSVAYVSEVGSGAGSA